MNDVWQLLSDALAARGFKSVRLEGTKVQIETGSLTVIRDFGPTIRRFESGDETAIKCFADECAPNEIQADNAVEAVAFDPWSTFCTVDIATPIQPGSLPKPRVTAATLRQNGFLKHFGMLPFGDHERAVFFGKYGKQYFTSLADFQQFTAYMSPATQDLYTFRDIENALANITPVDGWPSYTPGKQYERSVRELVTELGYSFVVPLIADVRSKVVEWYGDAEEFVLVAECEDCWLEVYVADRVD